MKTNVYDKKEKVLLLFRKNPIGEYVYSSPVIASYELHEKNIWNKKAWECMNISRGIKKNSTILLSSCLDSDGLLSKAISDQEGSVTLKGISKFEQSDVIAVVLDPEIESYVYNYYRDKFNKEISDDVFKFYLLAVGDKIGRSISKIEKKTLGGYNAITNGKFDSFEPNKPILEAAYYTPKPKTAVAEAGAGPKTNISTQSKNQTSTSKSNNIFSVESNSKKISSSSVSNQVNTKNDSDKIETENNKDMGNDSSNSIDVTEIKKNIRKKVINQDKTIDTVVNNIFWNQRYIATGDRDILRNKANILLDGSTGTGKTFIIEEVANELNLPKFVTGVTNYSSVGYRGADLTSILYKLLERADGDLELAERGIVAFDEFDKLGGFADNDVTMRKAIQQELLTFISGTKLDVEYNGQTYCFDTSKLTFIGIGAFTHLRERKIKENEKKYKSSIGFSDSTDEEIERKYTITKDDYVDEGLERELVGRFSCLTHTNDLNVDDLKRILNESITSPINVLKITGNIMGCNVVIGDDQIEKIAQKAYDTNTGARGLNEIVQSLKDVLAEDLFSGKSEVIVTNEHLDKIDSVHERTYYARKGY